MPPLAALPAPTSTYGMLGLLSLSLIAFAIFGGADFGAGIWDLFAFGRAAEKQREALIKAIGPIWEADEIWLVFLVTGLFTAFPVVFSSLSVALFIPAAIALVGTVMRGAAFAYYSHFRAATPANTAWGRIFSVFSVVAPFGFGIAAGTIASGHIRIHNGVVTSDLISTWLTPFPLICGLYAIAMCALLAAAYMVVEADIAGERDLTEHFRRRALLAYAITGVLGAVAGLLGAFDAPRIWTNLVGRALPFAIATALLGIATAFLLLIRRYFLARIAVAGTVAGIFVAWGVAQYPYLVPPDLTIQNTASPPNVMGPLLIGTLIGMAILLPSLWLMLYLFKARNRPQPETSAEAYIELLPPTSDATTAGTTSTTSAPARSSGTDGQAATPDPASAEHDAHDNEAKPPE